MTLDSPSTTLIPHQLILNLPAASAALPYSWAGSRWRAYLNQLCLDAFLPWLQEEWAAARVWPQPGALPSFWELVNGTALTCGSLRLVLIPTEAIDLAELRVPQEWVDIPTWAADYYVGLQVDVEEGYIRVWGYTSHGALKQTATYDPQDRAYSLDASRVWGDINGVWLAHQFGYQPSPATDLAALPSLSLEQAENLLTRLGNPQVPFPRLQVPFPLWAALLSHGGWRQRLYDRRQSLPEQWSLSRWLQADISALGQAVGWARVRLQPGLASQTGGWRSQTVSLNRPLRIADQDYDLQITPVEHPTERVWQFELRPAEAGGQIPAGYELRLLTADLQPFENNRDQAQTATSHLRVTVILAAGEGIVWEVAPEPEGYDREILFF